MQLFLQGVSSAQSIRRSVKGKVSDMLRRMMMVVVMAAILAMTLAARAEVTWKHCVKVDKKIDNALLTWAPWCTSWCVDRSDMSDIDSGMVCREGTLYNAMATPYYITEAWLGVCAYGVEPYEKVYVGMGCEDDGKVLGCLNPYEDGIKVDSIDFDGEDGNNEDGNDGGCSCTWFQLDPAWLTTDTYGKFYACVKGFKLCNPSECACIKKAWMKVTYAEIPAPGAAVLGAVGLTMVGWFKRKVRD